MSDPASRPETAERDTLTDDAKFIAEVAHRLSPLRRGPRGAGWRDSYDIPSTDPADKKPYLPWTVDAESLLDALRVRPASPAARPETAERDALMREIAEAVLDHSRALRGQGKGGIGKGLHYSYHARCDRALNAVEAFDNRASHSAASEAADRA